MIMYIVKDFEVSKSHKYLYVITQDFLTISRLYDINAKFGYLDEQQNKRKVYAKKKFIEIMKELKSNPPKQEIPLPPPPPII